MEINSFKTDPVLENNGVWVPCGNGRVLIASTGSDRYKKALQKALQPHELSIALNDLEDDVAKNIFIDVYVEAIVLNWEGFTEDGQPYPYSVENARRLLTEVPRFRDFVKAQAERIDNFRAKKAELETKN